MQLSKLTLLAILGAASTTTALPTTPNPNRNLRQPSPFFSRQTCVDTCGSVCYWESDITAALNQGYSLYQSGSTVSSNDYPHTYNDDEGFNFGSVAGPYLEFPILNTHEVYTGGSPGADRVVFNDNGDLAGLITHTGSSNDGFTQCTAD